jgi:cbb3-type cytochrome oxidase subunit 1
VHIVLAFVNVFGAATTGVLIGFDEVYHFLPGFVLANVFAHAHLAAIGWASMMVVGVAYRLLPMVPPAAMPNGPRLWNSAVLLQAGVSGHFVNLLVQGLRDALLTPSSTTP